MTFNLLDVVVLARDVPGAALKRGDVGTVVEMYEPNGLEVEFMTADGRTRATTTLVFEDVRPASNRDQLAVRSYDVA